MRVVPEAAAIARKRKSRFCQVVNIMLERQLGKARSLRDILLNLLSITYSSSPFRKTN